MRKTISMVLAGIILSTALTGCGSKDPEFKQKPGEILKVEDRIKYLNESEKDYKEIKVSKFIKKTSDLNQEGLDDINVSTIFKKGEIYTLGDVPYILSHPIVVDEEIKLNKINFNGRLEGSLKDTLNYIASLSNSYWTVDRGIIRFKRTNSVVYSLPLLSVSKTNLAFNAGSIGETDRFEIGAQESIYAEIENLINGALSNNAINGTISSNKTVNYTNSQAESKNKTREESKQDQISEGLLSQSNLSESKSGSTQENKSSMNGVKNTEASSFAPKPSMQAATTPESPNKPKAIEAQRQYTESINSSSNNDSNKVSQSQSQDSLTKSENNQNNKTKGLTLRKSGTEQNSDQKQTTLQEGNAIQKTIASKNIKEKVKISKESGLIQVTVTPEEEKKIDMLLKSMSESMLSSLITIEFFVLEVDSEKIAEFNQNFEGVFTNGIISKTIDFSSSGAALGYAKDALTTATGAIAQGATTLAGVNPAAANQYAASLDNPSAIRSQYGTINASKNLNFIVSYLTGDSEGQVLTQPKIVTLSNRLARLKEGVEIPYIKPGALAGDADNVTYQIEKINTGLELGTIANVLEDGDISISLGIKINQYLGDKTLNAGTLGTYNLPIQAPKVLNSTFRVKPGEIIVLGGSTKVNKNGNNFENLFIPVETKDSVQKSKFMILALPKLTKFIETGE